MQFFSVLLEQVLAVAESDRMGKSMETDLIEGLNVVSLELEGTALLFVRLLG